MGHGGEEGESPADEGDQADPGQVGEREDVERSGDGLVALHREGEDSQDRGVTGADSRESSCDLSRLNEPLREERSDSTEDLTEGIWILLPVEGELTGNTCN